MTAITDFRHPLERAALELAGRWCAGHQIGHGRALPHAIDVAGALRDHVPNVDAEVVAAVLLHDAPYFAPDQVDLYPVLAARLTPEVARIVRALEHEHATMDTSQLANLVEDRPVLLASTADKLVSMANVLNRSDDPPAGFLRSVSYFVAFSEAARPQLPSAMATELEHLVEQARHL